MIQTTNAKAINALISGSHSEIIIRQDNGTFIAFHLDKQQSFKLCKDLLCTFVSVENAKAMPSTIAEDNGLDLS